MIDTTKDVAFLYWNINTHIKEVVMLHVIQDLQDNLLNLIKDDPVRPEIPADQRVNANSKIFVLKDDNDQPIAVTCVKFLETIPKTVDDLADTVVNTNTAVFYTI